MRVERGNWAVSWESDLRQVSHTLLLDILQIFWFILFTCVASILNPSLGYIANILIHSFGICFKYAYLSSIYLKVRVFWPILFNLQVSREFMFYKSIRSSDCQWSMCCSVIVRALNELGSSWLFNPSLSCRFSRLNSVNLADNGGYWIVRDFLNYDLWKNGRWLMKSLLSKLIWNYSNC